MRPRHEASERQIQAARPGVSTWLSANAGSGKTRVLTDRVARLLLEGTEPQRILCLTYTKAAAGEMQNRLFRRLGAWAMLDDAGLRAELADLGLDHDLPPDRLAHARTLFARAIETPGGLKIQTIHSFCAGILRRFPLEAGVSPQFTEAEDRATALLRAGIVEDLADGPRVALIDAVAAHVTDATLDDLTAAIAGRRDTFATLPDRAGLLDLFGLPEDADADTPLRIAFDGTEAGLIAAAVPVLAGQSPTMVRLAEILAAINWTAPDQAALAMLCGQFLYSKEGITRAEAKTASVPTKKAQAALGNNLEPFQALMERVAHAREAELALAAVDKAEALHGFAAAFLPEYARRKQARGWLDFDDLIGKARQLLNHPAVAAWVLYRLDGGIDHILVDEAQDTSPAQWDVIDRLAQEFTSGVGSREGVNRTIFVVGDKKQSIYSFQGADPDGFDRMQAEFGDRLAAAGSGLDSLSLDYSFRSSTAILHLVDLVFRDAAAAGFRAEGHHIAFKSDLPGRVDLWPVVEKASDVDDRVWTDPIDRRGARHHDVILAERIANTVKAMIDNGETIPEDGPGPGQFRRRPLRPGDVLILVQRRSDLFAEIIRACKAAGLPIAGADRLKVGAELAVKDLAALLRFVATPEDDLSLAAALKSPLLGWSEKQLFDLAHDRGGAFLWRALRDREGEFPDTLAMLRDLRDRADFLRPFDLIERILTRHDGRRRLLGRLGAEAEDGINALLSQALAYESSDIPSLTGFLVWMETDNLEIKRQAGGAGNLVRVMTVHGAKGLEAPLVILPETGPRRTPKDAEIFQVDGVPLWKTPAAASPARIAAARDAVRARQEQERLRLLYVALTRAEKWLIVAAAGDIKPDQDCWYRMVEAAMVDAGAVPEGDILRLEHGDWDGLAEVEAAVPDPVSVALPGFLSHPAPAVAAPVAVLSPSDLGGAKALAGEAGQDEEAAKLWGTRVHLLLEVLPDLARADWPAAAAGLLAGASESERAAALAEAVSVLTAPALAPVFAPGSLAEVAVTADLPGGRRLHGVIDRLILGPDRVVAVDFKTNATVPARPDEVPEGLLRQIGAYASALAQICPDRVIDCAILWTRTATLMTLPPDLVAAALKRATALTPPAAIHSVASNPSYSGDRI
jgi:ATP-dependent helicase/nuclease subunit A